MPMSSCNPLPDFLPSPGGKVVAPEVLVVVELRLGGAGVLAAKHPHLPAGLGGHRGLVGTPGRRTAGGYHL